MFALRLQRLPKLELVGPAHGRPALAADEAKLDFSVRRADVVVVFGIDLQEPMLRRSKRCSDAGLLLDGRRLPVDPMPERGLWRWGAASPDGETILAQWTGECEVPSPRRATRRGSRPRGGACRR